MKYRYIGRDKKGQSVMGMVDANNPIQVAQKLKGAEVLPIKIIPSKQGIIIEDVLQKSFRIGDPSLADLILFTQQLTTLINAGVPLMRSLKIISETCKHNRLRSIITDVIISLEGGMSFTSALTKHQQIFSTIYCSIIEVGENSGHLDQALEVISQYLINEQNTRRRITAALRYPAIVLLAILTAIIIINLFVVPSFRDFFLAFNATLPLPTRILIGMSDFFIHFGAAILLFSLVALGFIFVYIQSIEGQWYWSYLKIKLPIFGSIVQRSIYARFCRAFSMVLNANIPLLTSFHVVANAVGNQYLAQKINGMRYVILNGESLYQAAKKTDLFEPIVLQMMLVGEETGDMAKTLLDCARFYEKDVDYDLKKIASLIEPVLIAIIACMVLILALGVFLPMWDISTVAFSKDLQG